MSITQGTLFETIGLPYRLIYQALMLTNFKMSTNSLIVIKESRRGA
jgi:hypothetical protein